MFRTTCWMTIVGLALAAPGAAQPTPTPTTGESPAPPYRPAARPLPLPRNPASEYAARPPVRMSTPAQLPAKAAEVKVVRLTHALTRDLSDIINRVFDGQQVRVAIDERTNAVIISSADSQYLERVAALIDELDRPSASPPQTSQHGVQSVVLGSADAEEVARHLAALARPSRTAPSVRVVDDARANTIWIAGAPNAVEQYAALARQMDQLAASAEATEGNASPRLHFYPIRQANPMALATTINRTLGMMHADTQVVADPDAGKLIAFVPADLDKLLTRLLAELDLPPGKHPAEQAR